MKEKDEESKQEHRNDALGRLLRMAGSRTAVPDDITLRVKASVHSHWKQTMRARTRTKYAFVGIGALAASLILYFVSWHFLTREVVLPSPVGIAENLTGNIVIVNSEEKQNPHLLKRGAILMTGSTLESDNSGRLLLRLLQGVTLRLDINSRLRLQSPSELVLDKGAAYLDCAKSSTSVLLVTPHGTVIDRGTQYEVRLEETGITIGVREGSVLLERENLSRTVASGQQLTVNETGATTLSKLPSYGSHWSWVSQVAPAYHLEGRSLMEFLGWLTRENGWGLSFSEQNIKDSAPHIILHGSVKNLNPDQMPEAVLPVCGLSYSVENGVLIIKPGKQS